MVFLEKWCIFASSLRLKTIDMEFVIHVTDVTEMGTGSGEITYLPRPSRYDAR